MPRKLLHPDDVRQTLARHYARQHRAWLDGVGDWPLRVALGTPTERDAAADPSGVRGWIEAWTRWQGEGTIDWQQRQWPLLGTQRLPVALSLSVPREVAAWAGDAQRWTRAAARHAEACRRWPALAMRPGLATCFDVLADWSDDDVHRLGAALDWLLTNPASGLRVRQLPIEGLDTKWLERRTATIVALLGLLRPLPPGADFHDVCGLKRPSHRVRMAVVCPALRRCLGGLRDVQMPVEELAALDLCPRAVLVVENQETGVAFPDVDGVVVFMQLGHAVGVLGGVPWLAGVPAVYWGDIDTHGLVILARARRALPGLRAVLMDEATLLGHRGLWTQEAVQHPPCDLPAWSSAERSLFDMLRDGVWGPKVRLEQERLAWAPAVAAVMAALREGEAR